MQFKVAVFALLSATALAAPVAQPEPQLAEALEAITGGVANLGTGVLKAGLGATNGVIGKFESNS